ncbi:vancomycin resistance protein VanJ [Curtobacterium sp. 314Chir4.1]|uniref:endonuclease/exonuclease/phosphatase family protein n=1 Tax=Curtobacterium sp. 314Chir4.1 TaxID=1279028 RepID=UPI000BD17F16|nr:endonuclease/exonuclease/phosphatase family protein [Curtobacterium sp. 314Chir4.1]SOC89301.1 vancomycin resistance protein VanJ [Curtobacterium sp. 314Chir4.1]
MPFRSPRRSPGRSLVIGVVGIVLLAGIVVLVFPAALGVLGTAGSVVGSLLPWLALLLVPVAGVALGTRSKRLAVGALAFAAAWAFAILPGVLTPDAPGSPQLTVVTENVEAANPDPAATARSIAARGPDVIALEELTESSGTAVAGVLDERYPHHYRVGSVGVWSRTTLRDGEPMTLGLGWARALRVTVDTDLGDVRLYVVHMDSLRLGGEDGRPTMLASLATAARDDDAERLVVAGDFNGGSKDPEMLPLTRMLDEGGGFGFTWPAQAPVVRIDHVFVRGLDTTSTEVLPANGSDHRGVRVGLRG